MVHWLFKMRLISLNYPSCWLRGLRPMCTRMSMDIRVHFGLANKISRRDSWSTTHRGWTTTPENQLLQCFEFHDKHGRNRRKKERICFDHELVRDQTNACGWYIRAVMKMRLFRAKSYPGLKALLYDYYSIRIVIMDPPVRGLQGPRDGAVPNNKP